MDKSPLTLHEMQMVYLKILKEFDSFCSIHNIRYYIGCGTLLGAVRHQGFIPWDDDLDVFIPEPDFKRLCTEYSSDSFKLVTCYNDKSHPYSFGRLYDLSTYRMHGKYRTYGCGIDLYIIYGAPNDKETLEKHKRTISRYLKLKQLSVRFRDAMVVRHIWPKKTLDSILLNLIVKRIIKLFERYSFYNFEMVWPYDGERLIMNKNNYGNPIKLKFEDGFFPAPEKYHDVLILEYGDYMQLPPEEKRRPYHGGDYYWTD